MKSLRLKMEGYAAVASFLIVSFRVDIDEFKKLFAKYTSAYLAAFEQKIKFIEELESPKGKTRSQKNVTQELYEKADEVNTWLNLVSAYLKKVKMDVTVVTMVKKKLKNRNIEGAVFEMHDLITMLEAGKTALIAEGMQEKDLDKLRADKDILNTKNIEQNKLLNERKVITDNNRAQYEELYAYISEVCADGKIVFAGNDVKTAEYTVGNILARVKAR